MPPDAREEEADTPNGVDASVEARRENPRGAAFGGRPPRTVQTFPHGEGGPPQRRRMRGAAEVTGWKYVRSKAPLSGAP